MKDLSECRILIVDDVSMNVDILTAALHGEHKLSIAIDGPSALRAVDRNPPDLILLDIMMPGMDGYEVCRRLRASEKSRDIPVMFLSALEDVQNKAKGFEVGGNDYLTKPFEILEVKARVKSLLKAKAYADAIREAVERELRIAREIQMGLLPTDLSPCTGETGLDIHAIIEPARRVGGDLYEVRRLDQNRILIVVADVMGKGISSSLFMAVTVTLLRTLARQFQKPEEILAHLNNELHAQNPRKMFVTMACLMFDLEAGTVTGASAGHTPVVLIPPKGEPRFVFKSSGMVLALRADVAYSSETLALEKGDALVLYSDGITEAENPQEEQFESERLLQSVTASREGKAAEVASRLLADVRTFASGAAQTDDITIVSVRKTS